VEVPLVVEVKFGLKTVDLPYMIRLYGITEELFDEMVDEDMKAELLDGVMIVHSPASLRHDNISGFLRFLMRGYSAAKELGLVLGPDGLVHLATGRRFGADMFFIRQARVPLPLPKQFEGAPDLVVEVLSPSNRDYDLEEKRPAYRAARVGEIWLVDPDEQQILVDRRRGKSYREEVITTGKLASSVLQGFWIDVDWLWTEPLPNEMTCLQEILSAR
jgi:Uma2 family endonuclease